MAAEPSTTMSTATPNSRVRAWALLAIGVLSAVVGFGVVVVASPGEKDRQPTVALEAAGEPGADAFTPSVNDAPVEQIQVMLASLPPDRPPADPDAENTEGDAIASRDGSRPGLYGGSRDAAVCDAAALVGYLAEEPEKAQAWSEALGISVDEIEGYVRSLTPVVLTADTWVTNHGFSAGRATPRQSVLQAGTAVMIDRFGVPRVRCECGNPLAGALVDDTSARVRFDGARWDGFDATDVITVAPAPSALDTIEVAALDGSGTLDLGTGTPTLNPTDLLSVTVTGLCGAPGDVTLVDGADPSYPDEDLPSGFAGISDAIDDTGTITGKAIAVGDLDGRPGDEAAAIFECNGGGSRSTYQIYVFRATPDGPVEVGEVPWDNGVSPDAVGDWVSDLSIADGWLSYHAGALGPNDANCCPSVFISRRYRLDGHTLLVAPPGDAVITPSGLGPARVGTSYEEVALALGRELRLFTLDGDPAQTAVCASINVEGAGVGGIGSGGAAMSFSVRDSTAATPKGITVGSSLEDLLVAYPTARAEPNQYLEWPDYYVDETADDGTALALRFILGDDQRVEEIDGGVLEFVSLTEGCA